MGSGNDNKKIIRLVVVIFVIIISIPIDTYIFTTLFNAISQVIDNLMALVDESSPFYDSFSFIPIIMVLTLVIFIIEEIATRGFIIRSIFDIIQKII